MKVPLPRALMIYFPKLSIDSNQCQLGVYLQCISAKIVMLIHLIGHWAGGWIIMALVAWNIKPSVVFSCQSMLLKHIERRLGSAYLGYIWFCIFGGHISLSPQCLVGYHCISQSTHARNIMADAHIQSVHDCHQWFAQLFIVHIICHSNCKWSLDVTNGKQNLLCKKQCRFKHLLQTFILTIFYQFCVNKQLTNKFQKPVGYYKKCCIRRSSSLP